MRLGNFKPFPWMAFSLASVFGLAAPSEPVSASNFLWVSEEVCTAGQPSLDDLVKLKVQGVRAILNLRVPSEDPLISDEEKQAQALGLKYFNLPVDSSRLGPEQVERFFEIVDEKANRPLLIHCASANRVGAFWLIYRVKKYGWSFEEAEKEARKIGLRSAALLEFAREFLSTP